MPRLPALASLRAPLRLPAPWVGLLLLLLVGCSSPYEPPLRVGTNLWIGYEPLYLARHLGRYGDEVKLVELTSATDVMHVFRNHLVEVAALTLDEALTLRGEGVDLRVVLALSRSLGADALLAAPGVRALGDLRGRRIGVENTAVGALILNGALAAGGLAPADVIPVALAANDHLEAYRKGTVDAVVTYEPMAGSLKALGAHPLFTSGDLTEPVVDVIVVHAGALEERRDAVARLVQGWLDALSFLAQERQVALAVMGERSRLEPAETAIRLEGLRLLDRDENMRLLGGEAPPIVASVEVLAAAMVNEGLLPHGVSGAHLVDLRPLAATR